MTVPVIRRVLQFRKRQKSKDSRELNVLLDKESTERLKQLKERIPKVENDNRVIALALKCLEQKTDRIIKRQVMKKILALKSEGLTSEQIAEILNDSSIPTYTEVGKWNSSTISRLLNKWEKRDFVDRAKNAPHRNRQPGAF